MENASKALIMAGGVLIAILLIGLLVYTFTNVKSVPQAEDQARAAEQLSKQNQELESYNKGRLYSTDVISVINKARDIDDKNANDNATAVTISVDLRGENIATFGSAFSYSKGKIAGLQATDTTIQNLKELINNRIFKCTGITYKANGRVNTMSFVKVDNIEE